MKIYYFGELIEDTESKNKIFSVSKIVADRLAKIEARQNDRREKKLESQLNLFVNENETATS